MVSSPKILRAAKNGRRPTRERSWTWTTLGFGALAVTVWAGHWVLRGRPYSGDLLGLVFGGISTALLTVAVLYGVRRRAMSRVSRWRLGSARHWLRWHIHGSALFLLTMILHSGLGFPTGALSWALWLLSLWVVATGYLGLALQCSIPRVLSARTSVEVLYERIPDLVDELRQRAEHLVEDEQSSLGSFYHRRLAPLLAGPRRDPLILLGGRSEMRRLEPLEHLRPLLDANESQRLEALETVVRTKLDLDAHYTLQQALRGWLWLHVPTALVLWLLVLVHVATVLYY